MSNLNHEDTKAQSYFAAIPNDQEEIGKQVVDCAFQVHKTLGAGLLENIYEAAFIWELENRNISFETQKEIPIQYKSHNLDLKYRLDLLIGNKIIVELKCVERLSPIHDAQILTYLKLMDLRLGYLINFNVPMIKNGIKRKVL